MNCSLCHSNSKVWHFVLFDRIRQGIVSHFMKGVLPLLPLSAFILNFFRYPPYAPIYF